METDDKKQIIECLNGNTNAYGFLVNKYQKPIYNLAYRLTRNFDDAEEITQISFIKAYENLESFNPKYKFFSWIYRIAINESLNLVKRKTNIESISDNLNISQNETEEIVNGNELSGAIQNTLVTLDFNYRIVIVLKHFLNFSYKEISDILEIPVKTVKSRLFTARQIIKDNFIKNRLISND